MHRDDYAPWTFVPWTLTWTEVDPDRHAFAADEAMAIVDGVTPKPTRRQGGAAWTLAVTQALAARFGRWIYGWAWGRDESDLGGGPVGSWCCLYHSVTTPAQTVKLAHEALCEWRAWLEKLAVLFDSLALPAGSLDERTAAWERAVTELVTEVVEQTGAGDAWYRHCAQVLDWFLAHQDVAEARRSALVAEAIDGRFDSWVGPSPELLGEIAQRIAVGVEQTAPET